MAGIAERLQAHMRRAGVGAQTLSKLTGIPRTAIDNWRDGTVRRPRHWRPLLRIAHVLSLSRREADELLGAAGHPPVAEISRLLGCDDPDRAHLSVWLASAAAFQLRAPAADFVGRSAALAALLDTLGPGSSPVQAPVAIIRGMGGVGKTELALLAAARVSGEYPDGQLLLTMHATGSHPLTPAQALRQVIHSFSPDTVLGEDLDDLQRRYCGLLSGKRVLILADDAAGAAQIRPLLPPAGNAMLVTSRNRFTVAGCLPVDLEQLDPLTATQLLRRICSRLTQTEASAIARACGGLPLALRISGGLLTNDPALPVAEHLATLRNPGAALTVLRDPDDPQTDLARCLMLSYSGLDPQTQAVFRRLGVFAGEFSTALAGRIAPAADDIAAVLRLLARRNLIRYHEGDDRWTLHSLVLELACGLLAGAGEVEQTMWRYAHAGLELAEQIGRQFVQGGELQALAAFDRERSHVDAAWAWAAAHAGSDRADRLLLTDMKQIAFLRYQRRAELEPRARLALEAARRLADHEAEAAILNRLGQLHLDLGEPAQAIDCFQQQLTLAADHQLPLAAARALNNLGLARIRHGEAQAAVELYRRQLDLVSDARGEAMARCNLGAAYLELSLFEQAQGDLDKSMAILEAIGERYGTSVVLHQLGLLHLQTGATAKAVHLLDQALAISHDLDDRHSEAIVLADLACAHAAAGLAGRALQLSDDAIELADTLGTLRAKAIALYATGCSHSAAGHATEAATAFEAAAALFAQCGDRSRRATTCQARLQAPALADPYRTLPPRAQAS